jgi:hypothetical protein
VKSLCTILLALIAVTSLAANVDLDLFNSFALLDENNVPLQGDTSSGDLVQLLLTGPDNAIDAPGPTGEPTGDDALLFTTFVGAGLPSQPNQGLLDVAPITYADTLIGSHVYVRFWNAATAESATHYGDSAIFPLPAGDIFNQALLDFVPSSASPRTTSHSLTPSVTGAAISTNRISLSWTPPVGAVAGYKIFRNDVLLATTNSTQFTDTGLMAATQYCYSIVAVDGDGAPVGNALDICLRTFFTAGSQLGIYNGLAIQTNAPTFNSSASLRLALSKTGSYAAKLTIGGQRLTLRGQFDEAGNSTNTVSPLQLVLHLDAAGGSGQITGTITGNGFTSELLAERASANAGALAGRYTFVLPPVSLDAPQGFGYGSLSVAATGKAKLTGVFGDGTKFKSNAPLSSAGHIPLFASLYQNQGACISWLTITNQNLEAVVDWFGPGFSTVLELMGGKFVSPNIAGNRQLTLSAGGLTEDIFRSVTIDAAGKATVTDPGPENLSLNVTPATGQFKGVFIHPGLGQKVKFAGQLLPAGDTGAGTFLGSGEAGGVLIEPAP